MNRKRGFTLIELLVVIAIIGILSSIVLVALRGARNQAKDSRIIAEMSQMRSLAELLYAEGSYSAFDPADEQVAALISDISDQQGSGVTNTGVTIHTNGDYCAYAELNSNDFYCIDSSGRAVQLGAAPSLTCATGTYNCE